MPELSSIQTYEKIEGSDFKPTLERFSRVLKNIELWNSNIEDAFNRFEWNVDDNGFLFSPLADLGYYASGLSEVKIRPHVTVFTPQISDTFKENWIQCELLMETEELIDQPTGKFHPYTYGLVKALSKVMFQEFKQAGIYFTDEAQDGQPFDGLRCGDETKLWEFDYAVIPLPLEKTFSIVPKTHCLKKHDSFLEAWHVEHWREKPSC